LGVGLAVTDDRAGLRAAIRETLPEAAHQHLLRNEVRGDQPVGPPRAHLVGLREIPGRYPPGGGRQHPRAPQPRRVRDVHPPVSRFPRRTSRCWRRAAGTRPPSSRRLPAPLGGICGRCRGSTSRHSDLGSPRRRG
jgi:hypothetical protein